jgi:hypothetical protein
MFKHDAGRPCVCIGLSATLASQEQGRHMKAFALQRYGKKRALNAVDMPLPEVR